MEYLIKEESLNLYESSLTHVSFLGRGGFGSVSLKRDSNFRFYAQKSSSWNHVATLKKELRIMHRFRNHPRIIQPLSSKIHLSIIPDQRCSIYMEYASQSDLHTMISDYCGNPMPEKFIRRAAHMILEGLEAFHSQGYVHCDIKPENIFVFPSKTIGEPWELKLADFGLSKEPYTDAKTFFGGTKEYMSPESFGPNRVVTSAVDIWSLGCVIVRMFGGFPVKRGDSYVWRVPRIESSVAKDFLQQCFAFQPSRRATAEELLKHPFVAQRLPKPEMHMCRPFSKFPCAMMNNVMEDYSRRQEGRIHDGFVAQRRQEMPMSPSFPCAMKTNLMEQRIHGCINALKI